MKIPERLQNVIDKGKSLTRKQLNNFKTISYVSIGISAIVFYWLLHWRMIGMTLIVVSLIALGVIMFLESRLPGIPEKKGEKKKKFKMTPGNGEEEDTSGGFNFGSMGLPSSEEYNKRVEDAFSFKGL
jgi:hypothetical protein